MGVVERVVEGRRRVVEEEEEGSGSVRVVVVYGSFGGWLWGA